MQEQGARFVLVIAASEADSDPLTYRQAINSPLARYWITALDSEYASIKRHQVWLEVTVPEGCNLIGSKVVFKRKMNSSGIVVKFKARVVAQGFSQVEGEDFDDTYSPVSRLSSLRALLAIVSAEGLFLYQMDADTAFLNGTLTETICM
jgi:hypothetical protein